MDHNHDVNKIDDRQHKSRGNRVVVASASDDRGAVMYKSDENEMNKSGTTTVSTATVVSEEREEPQQKPQQLHLQQQVVVSQRNDEVGDTSSSSWLPSDALPSSLPSKSRMDPPEQKQITASNEYEADRPQQQQQQHESSIQRGNDGSGDPSNDALSPLPNTVPVSVAAAPQHHSPPQHILLNKDPSVHSCSSSTLASMSTMNTVQLLQRNDSCSSFSFNTNSSSSNRIRQLQIQRQLRMDRVKNLLEDNRKATRQDQAFVGVEIDEEMRSLKSAVGLLEECHTKNRRLLKRNKQLETALIDQRQKRKLTDQKYRGVLRRLKHLQKGGQQ